ncbi:MAG: DUF4143 domain-containing protein, partial [Deltaproteobacteria bacterium]|nr:DUF4143 domain-containing protein [Deltaproteobacteria bacterium]
LTERIRSSSASFVIIDEIQKIPALLDEVHRQHERGVRFALFGSSARKVRHGHANLLGGRAIRFQLFGLVSGELGDNFDLSRCVNHGFLPRIYNATHATPYLHSYVTDYLREEIAAEGLARRVGIFDDFLRQAALSDTAPINATTIARECGISADTVRNYFEILEDTLMGTLLPAFTKRPKRRITKAPKFYFHDVGIVNSLLRRGRLEPGTELFGRAFENWIHHELRAYNSYRQRYAHMTYWRLSTGVEVDFLINDIELAVECKASERVRSEHLKGLRELAKEHPTIQRRVVVSLVNAPRMTKDRIEILPVADFCRLLWTDQLF